MLIFTEPKPREVPQPYELFEWPRGLVTQLNPAPDSLSIDLAKVIENRRSRRSFPNTLDLEKLGSMLWLSCRTQDGTASEYGFNLEYQACPSGGAIHPIHILIQREADQDWEHYHSIDHTLVQIPQSVDLANKAREMANNMFPIRSAALILFVAELGKSLAKYEHPETLILRDTGIILGYFAILSEALSLNYCPLGVSGHEFLGDLAGEYKFQGVGMALLSSRLR